ncbi:hypothetical protein LPB248_05200 [Flavobacterium sp. LPB0248]|uniref:hypothetical protein n=1 Tax=Flavobacterium sp. LPB0248 TaxID=2614441 RepID=UPI0015A5F262|nr:hypothetical protein [Flavobacterium sp. LPB0248]QLC65712.1 hypothetical protein LPB248_05200 [Flavobacterium sp. LPB0248]
MKFPSSPEDLRNEIFESVDKTKKNGDLRIRQLIQILKNVNNEIIIEGVLKVFGNENRSDTIYNDQKYAGLILQEINPKTDKNVSSILDFTLKNWNKSVFELPFWMQKNYGNQILKKGFTEYKTKNLSDIEIDNLKTMQWCLKIES